MIDSSNYRICSYCVMDTSDPEITFDAGGRCNHCLRFEKVFRPQWFPNAEGQKKLDEAIDLMKRDGKGKDYDCIIGLSGGVDSSYLAFLASKWGLRILAVHVDAGWNSELAVSNIENIVNKCKIDLHTYVVDWEDMKDLQLAYLHSGLANQDVPQDHVFFAELYKFAIRHRIRHILHGSNFATESIMPFSWGYQAMDSQQIKAIHRRFGKRKLTTYTMLSFFDRYLLIPYIIRLNIIRPLNWMPYDKNEAKEVLKRELCWKDYGVKHGESRFTHFYQNYYLPTRFGFDKRRAHLSSMIVSGLLTREEALAEMEKPLFDDARLHEDMNYFMKKLGLTEAKFDELMRLPSKTFRDYPSQYELVTFARRTKHWIKRKLA